MKIVIGIATTGRRAQMNLTLAQLTRQTLRPQRVIVCPASAEDFDPQGAEVLPADVPLQVVEGGRGSARQRNAILRACPDADLILFMDDDYYPAANYLEEVVRLFEVNPDVVVATNQPDFDGATGPGVSHDEAVAVIQRAEMASAADLTARTETTFGGYGCNMTVRLATVRASSTEFDEKLPLYGWLEDIDFSRRLAASVPGGRIVDHSRLRGVHLATKAGRTSGVRFGYSQVANPVYLIHKGSLTARYGFRQVARNLAKNLLRAAWPEPWVDRRGRLKGNVLAMADWLRGRLQPDRVLSL